MGAKLELRPLREEDQESFTAVVQAFKDATPPWDFAFYFDPQGDFRAYVKKLEGYARGEGIAETWVPNSFLVGVVDGEVVGRVSIRHRLNDVLRRLYGHIGYGVAPSCRRRGYATEMLRQALPLCARLGIDRALVTCDVDNIGSRKVIERCGGQFESVTDLPELEAQKRRYWIDTGAVGT